MTATAEWEFLSVTDTAKVLRATLKKRFPGVKFSVRSDKYAGGASIDIFWTDGPTAAQVDEVAGGFAGARFDGMVDMASYVSSWLEEDGTAHTAYDAGTGDQRGSRGEFIGDPRSGGARLVHFGADHVMTHRTTSPEFERLLRCLVTWNGRGQTAERCDGCGGWQLPETCGVVRYTDELVGTDRVRFVCSIECGAHLLARFTAEDEIR